MWTQDHRLRKRLSLSSRASTEVRSRLPVLLLPNSRREAPGTYQLGVRMEIPRGVGCWEKMTVKGTVLNGRKEDQWLSGNTAVYLSPMKLSSGLYDATFFFACSWDGKQVTGGRITILVAHPGELAPEPARPDDFVHVGAGAN